MIWGFLLDFALDHSTGTVMAMFGLYMVYEIRIGVVKDVRVNQRILGVALYRVIERDEKLDEDVFREALWDNGSEQVLISELDRRDDP